MKRLDNTRTQPKGERGAFTRLASRMARDRAGDTAVEFALIGAAFFLFVFAVFVFGVDQFWQLTLDDAVRNAARQVQIGKITSGAQFVSTVCGEFGVAAPNCSASLQYDVQCEDYYGAITVAQLNSSGTLAPNGVFSATLTTSAAAATSNSAAVIGTPEYLLVQVAYALPFKIFAVPGGVATQNGTSSLYSSVATVMEP